MGSLPAYANVDEIRGKFFEASDSISLESIVLTGHETHMKGRITSFAELVIKKHGFIFGCIPSASEEDKKIVYKPRDVRVDMLIAGKSDPGKRNQSSPKSYFELFNAFLRSTFAESAEQREGTELVEQRVATSTPGALVTIKYLPSEDGSYGFAEFIDDKRNMRLKLTKEGAVDLAWRLGANYGMVCFTSLLDQHKYNGVAVGNSLCLVDLEVIFDPCTLLGRKSQANGFTGIMAEINPAEVKTIPTGFLLQRPLEVGSELFRSLKQEMSSAFAAGFKKAKTFIEQKDLAELFQKMPTESPLTVRLVLTSTFVLQQMLEGNLDKGVFVEKLKKIVVEELNERFSQDLSLQDISFNETNLEKAIEESFDHHDVPKFTMTLSEGKYQIFCNSFQICEVKANILEQYQAWRTARLELDNQDFLKVILGEMENLNELGKPFDQFFRIINGLSGKSSS